MKPRDGWRGASGAGEVLRTLKTGSSTEVAGRQGPDNAGAVGGQQLRAPGNMESGAQLTLAK